MAALLSMLGIGGTAAAGGAAAAGAGGATGGFLKALQGELASAKLPASLASQPQIAGAVMPRSGGGGMLDALLSNVGGGAPQSGDLSGGFRSYTDFAAQANPFVQGGRSSFSPIPLGRRAQTRAPVISARHAFA